MNYEGTTLLDLALEYPWWALIIAGMVIGGMVLDYYERKDKDDD